MEFDLAGGTRRIATLTARIAQLAQDGEREAGLNRDAGETIARLEWEQGQLLKAGEGHEDRLAAALAEAQAAAEILTGREAALSELSEDVARLSARHHSAHRLRDDATTTRDKNEAEANRARLAAKEAEGALGRAGAAHRADYRRAGHLP